MINLSIPPSETQLRPRITVVGVGGAGGNAVNNMIKSNLEGVEFLVANTDAQALAGSLATKKLQLGVGITQGLGAGSRPDVGRAAAEEALEEIVGYLDGSHMVFITAGMGGGTGTGAAPVIARAARDQGILTVGVVTKPFHFEGAHRMRTAENGLNELQQYVDTLIVIPNQNLFRIANEKTTFADAFKMADDVLHSGVRGVTDLMVMPGLINLDFADIRTVMGEMGKAMMGTGEAEGEQRSVHAAEAAISNPLLDDVSMKGARGVLINITGGLDMTLYEVDEAANRIRDEVDPEANIIFGSTFDESMEGRVRVSVVATGIDLEAQQARPTVASLSLVGSRGPIGISRPAAEAARPEPAKPIAVSATSAAPRPAEKPAAAPVPQPAAVKPSDEAVLDLAQAVEELRLQPADQAARTAPSAANPPRGERREGAFIAPRPVEPSRPQPIAPPRAESFAEAEAAQSRTTEQVKKKAGSIFRRVTGLLRDEEETPAQPPAARPQPPRAEVRPQPEARPQAPVQAPRLDVGSARGPLPKHEDDALDIPAFLRRQAN